jgi:hypothetical protein
MSPLAFGAYFEILLTENKSKGRKETLIYEF